MVGIDAGFQRYVHGYQQPGTKALIYCFASWCDESVRLMSAFGDIALNNDLGYACARMDTSVASLYAEKYFVRTIPAVLVFHDAMLVERIEGTHFAQRLQAMLQGHGPAEDTPGRWLRPTSS